MIDPIEKLSDIQISTVEKGMNTKLVDVHIKKECLSGQITSNIKRR